MKQIRLFGSIEKTPWKDVYFTQEQTEDILKGEQTVLTHGFGFEINVFFSNNRRLILS